MIKHPSMRLRRFRFAAMPLLWCLGLSITTDLYADKKLDPPPGNGVRSVTFHDIVPGGKSGIDYQRVPSASKQELDRLKQENPNFTVHDVPYFPAGTRGIGGVALFDYDNDGDIDMYIPNGPGADNSLYSNQLVETGKLTFVDVGASAGVGAKTLDNTGVCFGDIDNDGDEDLYVLTRNGPNRLFLNLGNGKFKDITDTSGAGGGNVSSSTCSMGDVNGDGLLDIAVANTYDYASRVPMILEPFSMNHPNHLFLNQGDGKFRDVSEESGIRALAGLPKGAATITWVVGMVDYDQDGNVDIIFGDEQGPMLPAKYGGVNRGYIRVMRNDGTGRFTDVTPQAKTDIIGAWMGLTFGDLNCDGNLDMFLSSVGDYFPTMIVRLLERPYHYGEQSSRWFLGQADGTFLDPGVGKLRATPLGWGASITDYDNDGDQDIIYHGGLDFVVFKDASNPGTILQNQDCSATFVRDKTALAGSTDHRRRNVGGVAVGDLNNDGFPDIVSVSNFDVPKEIPLQPFGFDFGSPFDADAAFISMIHPTNVREMVDQSPRDFLLKFISGLTSEDLINASWNGLAFPNGSLSVELNSADNGNRWAQVRVRGMVGLVPGARVNRDGIGAVVKFTPEGGRPVLRPILGGASYGSQDSLTSSFGLGRARRGVVEVLWPGGKRNRLYDVEASERIVFPEIPCDFRFGGTDSAYGVCLDNALNVLVKAGVIDATQRERFKASAVRARQAPLS